MRRVIVENSGRRGKLESREEGVVIAEHTRGIPSIRLGTLRWGDTVVRAKLTEDSKFEQNYGLRIMPLFRKCRNITRVQVSPYLQASKDSRQFEMRAKYNGFLASFPPSITPMRGRVLSSQPLTEISRDIAAVIAENTQGWSFPARSPTSLCQLVPERRLRSRGRASAYFLPFPRAHDIYFRYTLDTSPGTIPPPFELVRRVFWHQKKKIS